MPGPTKRKRPHHRLQTLLNVMKRERERLNRSLDELRREDLFRQPPEPYIIAAWIDESSNSSSPTDDDSLDNGLVREDE